MNLSLSKIFGTDGVRGRANVWPMTSEVALALGRGIARLFKPDATLMNQKTRHRRVVIGKDTRLSGYMFENALSSGVCSAGADAILLGPLPTPAIAFITRAMRADAGVVISASHNPFEDNGIKFFDHTGFKLPDQLESKLEELSSESLDLVSLPEAAEIGRAVRVDDAPGRYIEFLKSTFPKEFNLDRLKIVLDCANGAAYRVAPIVLEELGAEVIRIGVSPNGVNINEKCGALFPDLMVQKLIETGAHLGIALDGDADRVVLADEKGRLFDGDQILALSALLMRQKGTLLQETVVGTVMSNWALERFLQSQNISFKRTQVGDRYIVEALRRDHYNLGGEPSGHLIFLDHATTGDGMLAALQVLALMQESEKPLSSLRLFEPFPQLLENLPVKKRVPLDEIPTIQKTIKAIEADLSGQGRLLLRYSGTEPVLRLMLEGEDELRLKNWMEILKGEAMRCLV